MNEVFWADGKPHPTNARALLRVVPEKYAAHEPWFGMEQEYTFFRGNRPLGWPEQGYPAPQGPFYCGVGADEERLTGKRETASYKTFLHGVGNRGASIRVALHVEQAGKGYLEDRRPCVNIDPYVVARLVDEATCS